MQVSTQYFKYFLTQTATGFIYYRDIYGNLETDTVFSGIDRALPQHPIGWEDIEVSYLRNFTYWGINRSFTIPLKFVGDGAWIIRKLFYTGKGTEQPLTLVITKWDENTGAFELYYKGQLDLTQNINDVAEGVSVNLIEGGVLQLLKSYENTVVELPCDGSIPENIKVLADGIKFNDVFHYQILKVTSPYPGDQPLPLVFVSNDGDNINTIHGDQQLDPFYAGYFQKSTNFLYSNGTPSTVRIKGTISVKSDPRIHNTTFRLWAATSLSQDVGVGGVNHAVGLVMPNPNAPNDYTFKEVGIDGSRTFSFDQKLDLSANENLFIFFFNNFTAYPLQILGGTISISFSSRLQPSRVWGIRANDVWKLIGEKLNALASTTDYPFAYNFVSNLLNQFSRFVLTSGDAIRASTNPNYYQYFNQATLNPSNPNNTDYTQFSSIGPVIKITLMDYFTSVDAILLAALGNTQDVNGNDILFIEERQEVLDPSKVDIMLPQVANMRVSFYNDAITNWIKIGSAPNQYDETSGKYEYNNTNQYQTFVKSHAKELERMSKIRLDSYGYEFTRYNPQGGKSTTFNDSDSSLWFQNTDFSNFIFDYYKAAFTSNIQNTASPLNTNLLLLKGLNYQPIVAGNLDGEYFVNSVDFSIFMFNQPGSILRTIDIEFDSLLNGLPGDGATITFWFNGIALQTWTAVVSGINTPLNASFSSARFCNPGDNFYFTIETVRTCTVSIGSFLINIDSGYIIAQSGGPIAIQASVTKQLIYLPLITAATVSIDGNIVQVVSYGFQYFMFLSNVQDKTFNWSVAIAAFIQGSGGEHIAFDLWKNGVNIGTISYPGTAVQSDINASLTPQFMGTDTLNNYDIYWISASCTNVNAWIHDSVVLFESNSIKAYPFLRKNYDAVQGIPNPETAFNIEDFTPARMFRRNSPLIAACLSMSGPGMIAFQTADKNQFLKTTLNGDTIAENGSFDVHDLGDPLYLALLMEFDTEIPMNAKQVFDYAANAHIAFTYRNKTFYGFPIEVTIKPALKESQHWKLLASTANLVNDLVELDWDGITVLKNLDSMIPYVCPVHFIPLNYQKDARYNSYTMNEDFFKNRIRDYSDKNNYFAPWQLNDTISLQCQTSGLAPVTVSFLNSQGQPLGITVNLPAVSTPSLIDPQTAYQADIPVNILPGEGKYYIQWTMGTGSAQAVWISEGLDVKIFWPKSQLVQYYHTSNKQAIIFNGTPIYRPSMRVIAQINNYRPKAKFTTYVNEPQDITLLNSIDYDTWTWEIGFNSGIPDYMVRKLGRILGLDSTDIDGNQYTRDENSEVEVTQVEGQPKMYLKIPIREKYNSDGISINTSNQIEGYQQAGYMINAQAFGMNDNTQRLIKVNRGS